MDESLKGRIDSIIDEYQETWDTREVPPFEAYYPWQRNRMYNPYPEWMELTADEIVDKMVRLNIFFPEQPR